MALFTTVPAQAQAIEWMAAHFLEDPTLSRLLALQLPPPLSLPALNLGWAELGLVAIAFLVAIWSTAVGASGAVTFAAMASILPPAAVIPLHAVTISAANVFRTWSLRSFVDWRFVLPFVIGGLAGFILGVPVLDAQVLSPDALRILLGAFILIAAWCPLKWLAARHEAGRGMGGALTAFLTLFVGATTPLVAGLVGQAHADQRKVLGTLAACMLFQHGIKILIFGLIGFSFGPYIALLILLIGASAAGVVVGKHILLRIPPARFKPIFKAVLTILGLDLMRRGLVA